jgi:hypothetical protein
VRKKTLKDLPRKRLEGQKKEKIQSSEKKSNLDSIFTRISFQFQRKVERI